MSESSRLIARRSSGADGLPYLLFVPRQAVAAERTTPPYLLFLHGAGERGHDLALVRQHGPPRLIGEGMELPFVVVAPQCPPDQRWSTQALLALLDETTHEQRVDPDRVFVTGISMGGFATWALAIAAPERFAAIVPICGGGDPRAVCRIGRLPVWAFHGARDDVVPLARSQEMVEALRGCGGDVRFTVYPEAGHDSWTPTYANPELFDWLLAQRRPPAPDHT